MELKVPTVIRWYRYWQKKGGFLDGQENLCHFIRTVFFYAPARWFFFARTAKIVAPWSVTLFGAFLTSLWMWPKPTSLILVTMAVIVGICTILARFENEIEEFSFGIIEPIYPHLKLKVVGRLPVWFFLVAILLGLSLVLIPDVIFPVLFVLFVTGVGASFIVGAIIGFDRIDDYRENLKANRIYGSGENPKPSHIRQFLKIIKAYLLAAKKGICPFVEIKENSIVFYWE